MYFWTFMFWGLSFVWLSKVVETFGWVGGVSFRAFAAVLILLVLAKIMKVALTYDVNDTKHYAILGATSVAMNLGGMTYALSKLGTALTAILVTTIPLYSALIERVWGKAKHTKLMILGLWIGFGGVVILIGLSSQALDVDFLLGFIGSTIASFGFALGGNYSKVRAQHIGAWEQTIGTFTFGGLYLLPFMFVVPIVKTPTLASFGWLFLLAATASSLAYILYFRLVAEIGATKALTTEFMVPVVAVIVGAAFLGETVTATDLIGAACILLGSALVLGLLPLRRDSKSIAT
jgi:drug/metabolite transporter (DMT)-like permease